MAWHPQASIACSQSLRSRGSLQEVRQYHTRELAMVLLLGARTMDELLLEGQEE